MSVPSFAKARCMYPPPGATTTAVFVGFVAGIYGVSVGISSSALPRAPGAPFGHSGVGIAAFGAAAVSLVVGGGGAVCANPIVPIIASTHTHTRAVPRIIPPETCPRTMLPRFSNDRPARPWLSFPKRIWFRIRVLLSICDSAAQQRNLLFALNRSHPFGAKHRAKLASASLLTRTLPQSTGTT